MPLGISLADVESDLKRTFVDYEASVDDDQCAEDWIQIATCLGVPRDCVHKTMSDWTSHDLRDIMLGARGVAGLDSVTSCEVRWAAKYVEPMVAWLFEILFDATSNGLLDGEEFRGLFTWRVAGLPKVCAPHLCGQCSSSFLG